MLTEDMRRFLKAAEYIQEELIIGSKIAQAPLQFLVLLLVIADNEGINQTDVPPLLGTDQSTCSRNIRKMSEVAFKGNGDGAPVKLGHGLLTQRQHTDGGNKNTVHLSKRGKQVVSNIKKILAGELVKMPVDSTRTAHKSTEEESLAENV